MTSWRDAELRVVESLRDEDHEAAERLLCDVLESQVSSTIRRRALHWRSVALEKQGKLEDARADLLTAIGLAERRDYGRYTEEVALAGISRRQGDRALALVWYREALVTALAAEDVSAGTALGGIHEMSTPDDVAGELADLVRSACSRSWSVLGLDGDPPDDLSLCIEKIQQGESQPRRR